MDGCWRPKGEDAEYTLPDLLKNSRRMPEIVIVLKCKEEVSISRHMADIEDDLKAKFEKAIEDREAARVKRRQEAKDEKLKELDESPPAVEDVEEPTPEQIAAAKEAAMAEWEQARDEQEAEEEENDDEKPYRLTGGFPYEDCEDSQFDRQTMIDKALRERIMNSLTRETFSNSHCQ